MVKQEKARARGVLLIAALMLVSIIGGLLVAGAAGAQPAGGDPYVSGTSTSTAPPPPETSTPPPPETSTPPPSVLNRCINCEDQVLPFTGADLTLFVVTGLALVATGVVLVRRTRARREVPEV